jgi:hypothetical protein
MLEVMAGSGGGKSKGLVMGYEKRVVSKVQNPSRCMAGMQHACIGVSSFSFCAPRTAKSLPIHLHVTHNVGEWGSGEFCTHSR